MASFLCFRHEPLAQKVLCGGLAKANGVGPKKYTRVCPMASAWDDALEEDVRSTQELEHQHIAEADGIRSDTSNESGSEPSQSSPLCVSGTPWWARELHTACKHIGQTDSFSDHVGMLEQRPLRVVSCCTGCSAECEVMKAGFCVLRMVLRSRSAAECSFIYIYMYLSNKI
jgi:hypothetical protein